MTKEAKARILINDVLQRSGRRRFFVADTGPANIALEPNVKIKKNALDSLGHGFEQTASAFVDYLLLHD